MTGEHPQVGFDLGQPLEGCLHLFPTAAGQVGAPAASRKQGVAGEQGVFNQQTHGTGGVARGVEHGNVQPRQMELRAFGVGIRIVERPGGQLGGHSQILRAEVNRAARVRCQLPDGTNVVKMPVGQQDGLQRQSQFAELVQNGVGLIAGVDDTAGSTFLVVNDVAVGLISPQCQGVHVQHGCLLIVSVCPSAGRCPESGSRGRR